MIHAFLPLVSVFRWLDELDDEPEASTELGGDARRSGERREEQETDWFDEFLNWLGGG